MNIKTEKKEAAVFLGKKGRRVDFVYWGIIIIFVTIAPVFLFSYTAHLLSVAVVNIFNGMTFHPTLATLISYSGVIIGVVVAALFVIFVTFPIFHSFFGFSYRSYREGAAGRSEFLKGSGQGYFALLRAGFVSVGVLIISLVPVIASIKLGNSLSVSQNTSIAAMAQGMFLFIVALGIALGFCVFLLFRPIFLFGYFSARGENVRSSLKKSVAIMRKKRAKKLYSEYIKAFLPSILLALPTFMVLFFVDTLPKMMIVYYRLSDELVYSEI